MVMTSSSWVGLSRLAFCRAMPDRAGVVAIPSQVFYDDPADASAGRHLVRFAFCKSEEDIVEGLRRMEVLRP